MIDRAIIQVSSGHGGSGSISGRHEKFAPRGGPDGGDGGRGGSVYVLSDSNIDTLLAFQYKHRFEASFGGDGAGALRKGRKGGDVTVRVPVGTQIWTQGKNAELVGDLAESGQSICVAQGGRGGRGNTRFTSSTNQFPLLAEEGEPGKELVLQLELKLLADVGILGAPNAGKSSMLAAVTSARPPIANYPFTTLEPVLGVVEWRGDRAVMVDIPGLIEGAHRGAGLGHEFLRHVERTRVLVHVVDISAEDPVGAFAQINEELRLSSETLAIKPQLLAMNKMDIPEAREQAGPLLKQLSSGGAAVYPVSVATREGLDSLLDGVFRLLNKERKKQEAMGSDQRLLPVLRPQPRHKAIKIHQKETTYTVDMPAAARIAAMIDEGDWNARIQFFRYLRGIGVTKALESAGVAPGDRVRIGKIEWEWE